MRYTNISPTAKSPGLSQSPNKKTNRPQSAVGNLQPPSFASLAGSGNQIQENEKFMRIKYENYKRVDTGAVQAGGGAGSPERKRPQSAHPKSSLERA